MVLLFLLKRLADKAFICKNSIACKYLIILETTTTKQIHEENNNI